MKKISVTKRLNVDSFLWEVLSAVVTMKECSVGSLVNTQKRSQVPFLSLSYINNFCERSKPADKALLLSSNYNYEVKLIVNPIDQSYCDIFDDRFEYQCFVI